MKVEETDRQLAALESKLDKLMKQNEPEGKMNETNYSDKEI